MSRVADRFGRAAQTYESATPIQRQAAALLAERVMASGPPSSARVAEFGCGTGYLAQALAPRLSPALWVATDIAPAMALAARTRTPLVAVMDAARPALTPGFDLICSSLTLQWLADPEAALARWRALVSPGGLLAVATLLDGSFAPWRGALAEVGAPDIEPAFPSLDQARAWFGPKASVSTVALIDRHSSALNFLRAARAAGIDLGPGRALHAGTMRRAMAAFEARGCAATYEIMLAVERV
jgi:malonyl-CoA O-methyltransferase